MAVKPDLLGSFTVDRMVFEARDGIYARPISIWRRGDMVGYVPREELDFELPHARYVPDFLASMTHVDPWPGLAIAAAAVAVYRNAKSKPIVRNCEG